jgi:hypothetical protein
MYKFPGIPSFVPAGSVRPDFAGRITSEWFVSRAVDAISQAVLTDSVNRPAMIAEAIEARRALAACVATVDAAIADVCRGLDLPNPLTTETTTERVKRQPGQRIAGDPALRGDRHRDDAQHHEGG